MYDSEVMCRKELDTPWSIDRDFTVMKKIIELPWPLFVSFFNLIAVPLQIYDGNLIIYDLINF